MNGLRGEWQIHKTPHPTSAEGKGLPNHFPVRAKSMNPFSTSTDSSLT